MTNLELKEFLELYKIDGVAFANMIGKSPSTIRRWIKGVTPIPSYIKFYVDTVEPTLIETRLLLNKLEIKKEKNRK